MKQLEITKKIKRVLTTTLLVTIATLTTIKVQGEERVKKGWNIGPLPAVGYNSDLGFQYGVLADIFYFGDGSTYPNYLHKFNVEASKYTKGSSILHFFYDSDALLKGIRSTVDVSYLGDDMMDFTGFNGYQSKFDLDWAEANPSYYKMKRNFIRATVDLQGPIGGDFKWAFGAGFYSYNTGAVELEKYEGAENLFTKYVESGILKEGEVNGGNHLELKAGLVHDTRDHEADPQKGFFSEAILYGSPLKNSYLKTSVIHRGYLPIYRDKLTFAYRVALQATLAGEAPYYMLPNLSTLYYRQITSEGLGGINTLRGVQRNRVVGNGVAWTNLELRYRFLNFNFIKQQWYLALNPFFDAGRVIQTYRADEIAAATDPAIRRDSDENFHLSAGIGLKIVMNRNFIISVEWGKPFDRRDGDSGMNIGLNFIF